MCPDCCCCCCSFVPFPLHRKDIFYSYIQFFSSFFIHSFGISHRHSVVKSHDFIVIVLIDIISGIVSSYFVPRIDHGGVKFYLAGEIGGIYTLEYLVWISISLDKRDRFAVVVR